MSDLLDELKLLDPVAEPVAVSQEGLEALRTGVLASPRPVRRRWIAPVAAAAAVLIALAMIWPNAVGGGKITAVPMDSPSAHVPVNTWVPTATSPLSPRYASAAVWADRSFFVIGGTSSPVCPMGDDCTEPSYLRDGARYDPVTDTWSPIATAPDDLRSFAVSPRQRAVVLGRTIYLTGANSVLGYNLDAGTWRTLPLPSGDVMALGATGAVLIAVSNEDGAVGRIVYSTLDPDQGTWTRHVPDGKLRGMTNSAAIVGDSIVLTGLLSSSPAGPWVIDTIDLATGKVGHASDPQVEPQHLDPIALTTNQSQYAVWRGIEDHASFFEPSTGTWSSVALPKGKGAFAGKLSQSDVYWPITTAGMVSLRGYLYDPQKKLWSDTPAMPTAPDTPVVSGGSDSVLSCFGYDFATKTFGKQCFLLRPAEASLTTP